MKRVNIPVDLEHKTVSTFRQERSFNGYKLDVLKSWLQKAVRRGRTDEAVWAAVEMLTIPKQGVITNLMSRLRVISLEDVGLGNTSMVEMVERETKKMLDPKKRKPILPITSEGVSLIAGVVAALAESQHLRLCSDYKAVFLTPNLRGDLVELFPDVYSNDFRAVEVEASGLDCGKAGVRFMQMLEEKNDYAFIFLSRLMEIDTPKCYRSNKPHFYVMKLIRKVAKRIDRKDIAEEVKTLCVWLKDGMINSKVEHLLPLLYGISRLLKRDNVGVPETAFALQVNVTNFDEDRVLMKVPDFVVDKHTIDGMRMGKGVVDFAQEGALVENEAVFLKNDRYRDIYLKSKVVQEEIERKIKKAKQ